MTKKFSEIRRPVTPESRARIDTIKGAMATAERLAGIRATRGLTQVEVAQRLGKTQGNVSEIERRDDLYLSTLRDYIAAIGGRLELAAVFGDERWPLTIGELRPTAEPNILAQDPAFGDVLGAIGDTNILESPKH
jgi:transcriptional regulator with XRE-family HTH domain